VYIFADQTVGIMNKTKEHILAVALKLFLQKNYKEVTMKEIVDKTGLSKGAFYHYFASKEKLFEEAIGHFFISLTANEVEEHSKESLYKFYQLNLNKMNTFTGNFITNTNESVFDINFFTLMFDALKLFPDFKKKMEEHHKKELEEWISVIKNAKKKGEIRSILSDKQIAMLFIYSSDGLAMNHTLENKMKTLPVEIKSLWDNLYKSLKA
jgi:TetR/AcrR family transcriptional regulator, transcriptional repressor for nem operon